mmetsp:Transcript_18576/g.23728  ORF Transcript_18576/g.23728 Transcript_18576/m.23728 type:complete len:91 (+) Transcript_18576:30-302(+)
MLRSIATLTESRFETWLLQINGRPKSDGNNEATTKATQIIPPPQRQPEIIHLHTSSYQISKAVETLATLYEVPPSLDVKSASSLDRSATE